MNLHTHTTPFPTSKQGHVASGIPTMGSTFTSDYTAQMTTQNYNTGLGTVLSDSRQSTFSISYFTLPSLRLLPVVMMMMASGFWNVGWGQSLVETFNYTVVGNIGGNTSSSGTTNNNWTTHSNSQTGTVSTVTGSLSYTGINPANNHVNIPGANATTPRDINRACGLAASQNTTYYSFILNVTDATQLATSFGTGGNGYFFHLSTTNGSGASNFTAKVHIRSSNAAANFRLGVSETGNTPVEVTGDLAFGTTYLVVVKYVFNNTAGNDLATMWVNPSSLGTTESAGGVTGLGSANVTAYNSSNTGICIRNASATPKADIDEIRVGTTWAHVTQQNVDGFIVSPEYGTHTDGQNQQSNSGNVTYMKWDDNNLFVGVSGANLAEGYVLYLDKDPQVPVDGGSNSNGTNIGQVYDGTNFAALPFRADLVMYVKTGYREYRTTTGSNTWSAANTSFGNYAGTGTVREFSIPWSTIGGKPTSFNWFGYNTSAGGFVYNQTPNENAGGNIGTSARYERYYTVNVTTTGSSTPPFSRNSFVFNNTADENSFGSISVYDFTMNTSGLQISRGNTGGNWTIGGNLIVNNGTIFFGSPNTNTFGTTSVGNVKISGGSLNMDQTNQPMIVIGNVDISGGSLLLSGNSGGDIKVSGNWSRTSGTFTPNSRAVFLDAVSGDQSITKSGGETFDYLIIDKAAGNVVLNNDINVSNGLTLSNGKINTGANKVIQPALATIARTNGWINGNLQRAVSNGNNNFFIGTTTVYAPASLNMTGVSGPVDITGYLTAGVHPNEGSSTIDPAKKANHYWTLTKSGAGSFTSYTGTFNVANTTNTGMVANYKIAKFDSPSTWSPAGGSASGNDISSATFTSFSDFMAGEEALPPPTISFTGTLSALSTTYGTPSSETSFDVSGADMTAGILVTPPSGYEVSLTSGSGFVATMTVGAAGMITSTPVYVRLKADASVAGSPYSGNIVLSSAGASPVNVPTVASTVSTAALTITGLTGENKVYNGNTDATFTGTAAYSGLQNGEMPSITGTPIATFVSPNVGMGITINITGYTAPNTNYTLTQPTLSANITQKPLTITGITADNKVYDGNNSATLSGTAALDGVITADLANVTLGGTPVATFDDELVGMNKPVTVTGYSISGSASGNYSLSQPMGLTANITSAALPVITSPLTASSTYGVAITTYNITATNLPTSYDAIGLPSGLMVNMTTGAITGTPSAAPGMYNVTISATNGGGTGDAVLVFTINPKPLTVSGSTADNKIYTRTNNATISGSTLVGVVGMDDVTITSTGTFAQVTVGNGIDVTSTQTLGGADAGKYTVTLPTGLMADITQKELTVTGASVTPKTYTGTNPATITGATLSGVISPDVVTVSGGGTFADVNVANGISVTAALSLGGADLGNYSLTQPSLTGNITPAPLTITGITADDKEYDATDAATLTGTPTYVGLQNGEMFSVTGTPTATFNNKNVANGKPVTVTGYSVPSGNYTVTQPSLMADITPAALTVTGAAATNRVYDATNNVTVSGTLSGVLLSDIVNLSTSGTMADANAGSGKTVTFNISGADATNYVLTQPGTTVDISQASQSITFGALPNKTTNDVPFNAGATSATSGINALAYTSSLTSVATINPTTGLITIVGPGTTTITVSQPGNINYTAATSVQQTLTVTVAPVSIFANTITGTNPNTSNPYTTGQTFNANLMVSGIGRGSGINGTSANDRYNANSWNTTMLDVNDYFEFTITPNPGYEIDFNSFVYIGQASGSGPTNTSFRSNIDSYATNIGTSSISGTTISLSAGGYQNITSAIIFRFYAWGGSGGTFSINDFIFNGNVNCVEPIAYNVTGGGSYCSGGTGVAVGLSNSQIGVSYQLQKDNVDSGSPVSGTGSAISFGNQTAVGTYTVVASNNNGGCSLELDMTGSAGITINVLPTAGTCKTDDLCQINAGTVTVEASGGSAPYNVTWTPAHGTPSSGQSISLSGGTLLINGLHGGVTYTFTITDANGCSAQ